jgi:hypothetical protein
MSFLEFVGNSFWKSRFFWAQFERISQVLVQSRDRVFGISGAEGLVFTEDRWRSSRLVAYIVPYDTEQQVCTPPSVFNFRSLIAF